MHRSNVFGAQCFWTFVSIHLLSAFPVFESCVTSKPRTVLVSGEQLLNSSFIQGELREGGRPRRALTLVVNSGAFFLHLASGHLTSPPETDRSFTYSLLSLLEALSKFFFFSRRGEREDGILYFSSLSFFLCWKNKKYSPYIST